MGSRQCRLLLHTCGPAAQPVATPGFCNRGEVRYGSIGGLEYEVPQSRLYCLCINVALCSTALQCICRAIRRSSMIMKAHTYYIIFGRPPIGGSFPPWRHHCAQPSSVQTHRLAYPCSAWVLGASQLATEQAKQRPLHGVPAISHSTHTHTHTPQQTYQPALLWRSCVITYPNKAAVKRELLTPSKQGS